MTPVAIGLRAQRGGSVALAVALDASEPAVVLSTFLPTAAEGDSLTYEPYHVAAGMPRDLNGRVSAEAAAVVAEGRARQARMATDGLRTIVSQLRDQNRAPALAALLVNRAG